MTRTAPFWLALSALLCACDRSPSAPPQKEPADAPVFREVAAEVGLHFNHFLGATGK